MRFIGIHTAISNFLLYVLGFFLIWEWLRPMEQLTNTGNVVVFILFLLLSLVMAYLRFHPTLSGIIKIGYILFVLQYLYYGNSFFTFNWIGAFTTEVMDNFAILFDTNWPELTNMFKSLLFFILLWLMSYLIDYWLIKRRRIFTFFLLTMVYITVLDTFTPYDASIAIIRTTIIGFTAMGMLTFYRMKDKENITDRRFLALKWMAPLLFFVFASAAIAYAAPKANPIWPDPVPFIQTIGDNGGEGEGNGNGPHRVGYSVDDSRLGGDFEPDDTLMFQTEVESSHYWKVETKDTYTGKGWVQSEEAVTMNGQDFQRLEGAGDIPFVSFEEGDSVKTEAQESTVNFAQPFDYLLYPLGVTEAASSMDTTMIVETGSERISFDFPTDSYSVSYEKPEYSLSTLTSADMSGYLRENPEIAARYTQLPQNLPQRVLDLAAEITKDEDNVFAKARAIENYFSGNGFVYSQSDVAIPADDEDYVDQFLFETKIGYCDNYSTSMVVMLRSLGIPARWVKGFTEGELIKQENNRSQYEVTNNNAHSWVEAYFPGAGWVTFEPTQGFSNENTYVNDVRNEADTNTEENEQTEQEAQQQREEQQVPEEETVASDQSEEKSFGKWWNTIANFAAERWQWLVGGAVLIIAMSWILFWKRHKWLPIFYIWKYKRGKKGNDFEKAYLTLLKMLKLSGWGKQDNMTLREYAKYIDHVLKTNEMAVLTAKYEELLYKGNSQDNNWTEWKEMWERLIRKTAA
ncbi:MULTISPECIES: transglutaminase-like domain-containing protein [unclassified Niallia]|uniref:transglutaminase-like domain-containing protein n=1 Tax=unclassified Niallia TaxID=2837522 RepID=UPI001EDA2185|nr:MULTISPECIES: transglutaminase-like domain-containing protein [unclassified Niallia]MDL0437736.1 transglutaminaseTgpA domain-containing protein [Niallia sp. SS-2023]UPO87987.1 transglutaminaseTgpA domain-containing protein [Niallia sp. Man26]